MIIIEIIGYHLTMYMYKELHGIWTVCRIPHSVRSIPKGQSLTLSWLWCWYMRLFQTSVSSRVCLSGNYDVSLNMPPNLNYWNCHCAFSRFNKTSMDSDSCVAVAIAVGIRTALLCSKRVLHIYNDHTPSFLYNEARNDIAARVHHCRSRQCILFLERLHVQENDSGKFDQYLKTMKLTCVIRAWTFLPESLYQLDKLGI